MKDNVLKLLEYNKYCFYEQKRIGFLDYYVNYINIKNSSKK